MRVRAERDGSCGSHTKQVSGCVWCVMLGLCCQQPSLSPCSGPPAPNTHINTLPTSPAILILLQAPPPGCVCRQRAGDLQVQRAQLHPRQPVPPVQARGQHVLCSAGLPAGRCDEACMLSVCVSVRVCVRVCGERVWGCRVLRTISASVVAGCVHTLFLCYGSQHRIRVPVLCLRVCATRVCLQAIPGLSPVPWWGTLFPLAVVLMVNGVKEAFDDYWRHKSDETVRLEGTWRRAGAVGRVLCCVGLHTGALSCIASTSCVASGSLVRDQCCCFACLCL